MTLVAAIRTGGTPVLIGDALVTTNEGVVGSRKKVQRLRSNLAFGWTGLEAVAEKVAKHLDTALDEDHVTESRLIQVLESFPATTPTDLGVKLVGWLIDDEQRCFAWWSNSPKVVFSTEWIEGTGARLFKEIWGSQINRPNVEAEKSALHLVCFLMSDEAGSWRNWKEGFGLAYEILCWRDGSFQYVSNVAYTFAQAEFDSQGRFLRKLAIHWVFQYVAWGEYAVIECINPEKPHRSVRNLITPIVGDTKTERARLAARMISPEAMFETPKWVCMCMAFIHGRETTEPVTLLPLIMVADPTKSVPPYPRFRLSVEPNSSSVSIKFPSDKDIKARYHYVMNRRDDEKPSDRTWREYQTSTDPLRDVDLKLKQAWDRLMTVGASMEEYLRGETKITRRVYEEEQIVAKLIRFARPIPPEWSVTVGEIIHDLRSALDYLVFQLVALETGTGPTGIGNQFPICYTELQFDSAHHMLTGVGSKATALIRSLQPFATGEHAKRPLRALKEISNESRRREITLAVCALESDRSVAVRDLDGRLATILPPGPLGTETPSHGRRIPPGPEPLLERAKRIELCPDEVGVFITFKNPAIDFSLSAPQIIQAIGNLVFEIVKRVRAELLGSHT